MEIFDEGPFRNRIIGQANLDLHSLISSKDKFFEIFHDAASVGKVRLVTKWTSVKS